MRLIVPTFAALTLSHPVAAWADAGGWAGDWASDSSGASVTPETIWSAWNLDLLILVNLTLLGAMYMTGLHKLWRKRGEVSRLLLWRAAAFYCALVGLVAALISPLHALSEELASAHMMQHMLLMAMAAPLLVLGAPGIVFLRALGPDWRTLARKWRWLFQVDLLSQPMVIWALYAAALWCWHLPVAYEAALVDPLVHDAQHLSFFGVACLFWRMLLNPVPRRRLQPLTAVLVLFTTTLHSMLLGVYMALSPSVWYATYDGRTSHWGLTPLEDQQLAGLIMWMPACLVYPAAAAAVVGSWLSRLTRPSDAGSCYAEPTA
jgi:putative membrane protein